MQLTDAQIHKAFEFMMGHPPRQLDLIAIEVLGRSPEKMARWLKCNWYLNDAEITEEFILDTIMVATSESKAAE